MTTEELQQKHNKAIMGGLISSNDYLMANAAKQCTLITIEHTIGVLSNLYKKSSAGNVFADILSEMDELIKQKELL